MTEEFDLSEDQIEELKETFNLFDIGNLLNFFFKDLLSLKIILDRQGWFNFYSRTRQNDEYSR